MAAMASSPRPPPTAAAAAALSAPKRPVLTTLRSSQRGVAMSNETRPPRELLKKIGLSGKEVVKIIKERKWEIVEPHGLQQQKLYYVPGAKEKEEAEDEEVELTQRRDFFVGEGELYAFILKQGGIRYLLPDEDFSTESDESEVEPTQPSKPSQEEPKPTASNSTNPAAGEQHSAKDSDGLGDSSDSADGESAGAGSEQRRWKRRKKLSTARSKSAEKSAPEKSAPVKTPPPKRRRKTGKKNSAAVDDEEQDRDDIRVSPRIKLEQATYVGVGQQAEFSEYMSSLTARGWRAQLLQDVDVHLLRSSAAVDRRQRALEAAVEGQKKSGRPTEGVGPHVQDAAEILQELEGLVCSIRASQDDLSSMIEAVIVQAERSTVPDRIDPVGRIGIPGFVSTGSGSLVLMRDIERYVLLFVAAVRRYQRTRRAVSANEPSSGPSTKAVKRTDLRALQLRIEESKTELQELAEMVSVEVKKETQTCQDADRSAAGQEAAATPDTSTSQTTSQSTSQSTARPTECEADVDTDHDQSSSQQSVASSPRRLEGGQWLV